MRLVELSLNKNPVRDFSSQDRFVCLMYVRCPSGEWLVGPYSASSTITSVFIRLGHSRRFYGGGCAVTFASGQRRARYKALGGGGTMRLFRVKRPSLSFEGSKTICISD
jgi:hypothetical protein